MMILLVNPKTYLRKMLRMMMTISMKLFISPVYYDKKPIFWLFWKKPIFWLFPEKAKILAFFQ